MNLSFRCKGCRLWNRSADTVLNCDTAHGVGVLSPSSRYGFTQSITKQYTIAIPAPEMRYAKSSREWEKSVEKKSEGNDVVAGRDLGAESRSSAKIIY